MKNLAALTAHFHLKMSILQQNVKQVSRLGGWALPLAMILLSALKRDIQLI